MGNTCNCAEGRLDGKDFHCFETDERYKWIFEAKEPVPLMKSLVKIQSAARGFIVRKNFKKLLCNFREVKTIQELRKAGEELLKHLAVAIPPFNYEIESKPDRLKSFLYLVNKKNDGFYIGEWLEDQFFLETKHRKILY